MASWQVEKQAQQNNTLFFSVFYFLFFVCSHLDITSFKESRGLRSFHTKAEFRKDNHKK
jgi:hypothetical protein